VVARGLVRAADRLTAPGPGRAVLVALLAAVLVGHAGFVALAGPGDVPGRLAATPDAEGWASALRARYRFRLWPHTVRGLREQEAVIQAFVDGVRHAFDPAGTVLVTELGNPRSYPWFRHVMYYLPEYPAYHLRVGPHAPGWLSSRQDGTMLSLGGADVLLPSSARRLVWVVDYWSPLVPRPSGLLARPLPHGRWLYVLDLDRRSVDHAGYRLTPVTTLARVR
jgi:hypothetical protein